MDKQSSKAYAGYLIDLDGTMYSGTAKIHEAAGFVERLRKTGKPFLFLTNNSTAHAEDVANKLKAISDVEAYPKEIFTSTMATISYLKEQKKERLFVIGEGGLLEGLTEEGFKLTDKEVDAVVVGLDREASYRDFEKATLLIHEGADFIATNPDTNMPTEKGLVPGNGALVAFLEASTGREATVVGKPESIIMDAALETIGLTKDEVLMVGDNYTTDIQAGIRNGIDTLLVLTGFTTKEDVSTLPTAPTYVVDTLDDWDIR